MEIDQSEAGGVLLLRASGRLIIGDGDVQLRRAVQTALEAGNKHILLDLEGVRRIDSSGIGELVAQHISAHNRGGVLKLVNLSDRVGGMLKATRLSGVMEIFDDEKEALASFAAT